ncbi:hypothetical protein D3C72_1331280 [compost metagenome]
MRGGQQTQIGVLCAPFDFPKIVGHDELGDEALPVLDHFDVQHHRLLGLPQDSVPKSIPHHSGHPGQHHDRFHRRTLHAEISFRPSRQWRHMSGGRVHLCLFCACSCENLLALAPGRVRYDVPWDITQA